MVPVRFPETVFHRDGATSKDTRHIEWSRHSREGSRSDPTGSRKALQRTCLRTSRFLIDSKLVRKSEAYHIYADRLRKVTIRTEDRKVSLLFELDVTHATTKYWKGHRKVYLYDEIVERSLKMHREHVYCLRFMQPNVRIETIDVSIIITTKNYMEVLEEIAFSLIQRGYPDRPTSLSEAGVNVGALTGKTLHRKISKEAKDG